MKRTNTQLEWDFYQSHHRSDYSRKSGRDDPSYYFVRSLIKKGIVSQDSLIEIGFGDGKTLRLLSNHFNKIAGADISPKNIEITKEEFKELKINNSYFFVMDLMNNITDDIEQYNNVLLSHVLEHFTKEELETVIPNLIKLIKPGGKLIGAVPYKLKFNYRFCPHCHEKFELDGHQIVYDEEILRKTFDPYHLKEIEIRNYNFDFWSRHDHLLKKIARRIFHRYKIIMGRKPTGQLEFCYQKPF